MSFGSGSAETSYLSFINAVYKNFIGIDAQNWGEMSIGELFTFKGSTGVVFPSYGSVNSNGLLFVFYVVFIE